MTTRRPRTRRRLGVLLSALPLALVLVLAACGNSEDPTPTSVATTAPSGPTTAPTTTVPTPPQAASPEGGATAVGSPAGSPAAGATVGDLADRIAAAWSGVTTYRVNEITFPTGSATPPPLPSGSPVASPAAGPTNPSAFAIDEVVLPDQKRRRIVQGQVIVSEIVAVGGQVYARGQIVQQYVDPSLPPEAWVVLTPEDLAAGSPLGQLLQGFLTPTGAPLSALPPEQRALPVTPAGQTTAEGRTCDLYEIAQTTQTGERVDVSIALDASGLPCLVQTSAGGQTTVATYVAFNEPLTIEAPTEATPLPATVPAATPAPADGSTPAG